MPEFEVILNMVVEAEDKHAAVDYALDALDDSVDAISGRVNELDGPSVSDAGGEGDGPEPERAASPRPVATTPASVSALIDELGIPRGVDVEQVLGRAARWRAERDEILETLTSFVWATQEARNRSWTDEKTLRVFLGELRRAEALIAFKEDQP